MAKLEKLFSVSDVRKLANVVVDGMLEYSFSPLQKTKILGVCIYCGQEVLDAGIAAHDENCVGLIAQQIIDSE